MDDLEATERQKIRLTEAVGDIMSAIRAAGARGRRSSTLRARRRPVPRLLAIDAGRTRHNVLLVLGETSLRSRVWPAIFSAAASDDIAISLVAPDGAVVFATGEAPDAEVPGAGRLPLRCDGSMSREQTFQDGDVLWRVRATPRTARCALRGGGAAAMAVPRRCSS